MGNNITKADRFDEVYLSNLSEGMDTLRRSVDSYPDGTKKFKLMLDSNEKKVQDVLRRSRKGSTRKKALDILRELEDLKEKERASIRDSSLDYGAVESNSIIAGDAKRYDKSRQHSRSVEDLQNIRKKVDQLGSRISSTGTREEAATSRKEIEVLRTQLERVQPRPKSKLEAYKEEYKNKLRRYEQKLSTKEQAIATDGVAMSKMAHSNQNNNKQQQQSQPQQQQQQPQVSGIASEQRKHLNAQDELAMIQGQVMSLQGECETFNGYKDTPEYNSISQNLMKLWDKLGKIKDARLQAERDAIIALISGSLKQLNRKCVENTRGSLSNNKILCLVELFHMQYKKIAIQVKQGRVREFVEVYRILHDVHAGLGGMLGQAANECQLVTARMTPGARRRPVSIYKSSEQKMETSFDTVYVQDDQQPRVLKSNQSCPDFARIDAGEQVHATYVPDASRAAGDGGGVEQFLETLSLEANMLKYAVEEFRHYDSERYNALDERLIELLIQIESLKGKLDEYRERQRVGIMQRVQGACRQLKQLQLQHGERHQARSSRHAEYMAEIDATLARLEILKTQINESDEWHADNPELKVLEDALKSALLRLDLIEPGTDQVVQIARADAISEVRQAIKRLNEQRYVENRFAGTEV